MVHKLATEANVLALKRRMGRIGRMGRELVKRGEVRRDEMGWRAVGEWWAGVGWNRRSTPHLRFHPCDIIYIINKHYKY